MFHIPHDTAHIRIHMVCLLLTVDSYLCQSEAEVIVFFCEICDKHELIQDTSSNDIEHSPVL